MEGLVVPFADFPQGKRDESVGLVAASSWIVDQHKSKEKKVQIDFATPTYFPIYLISLEGELFAFDSSLNFSSDVRYDILPDGKGLLERLRKYSKDDYSRVGKSSDFFQKFQDKKNFKVQGLMNFPNLNMKHLVGRASRRQFEGYIYTPNTTPQKAAQDVGTVFSQVKALDQKDIEELKHVKEELFALTTGWMGTLEEDKKNTPDVYVKRISGVKQRASERIQGHENEIKTLDGTISPTRESWNTKIADADLKIKDESRTYDQQEAMLQAVVTKTFEDYRPKIQELIGEKTRTAGFYDEELARTRKAFDVQIGSWENQIKGYQHTIEGLRTDYTKKRSDLKARVDERISALESERDREVQSIENSYVPKISQLQTRKKIAGLRDDLVEEAKRVDQQVGKSDLNVSAVSRQIEKLGEERDDKVTKIRTDYKKRIDVEQIVLYDLDKERDGKIREQETKIHEGKTTIDKFLEEKSAKEKKTLAEQKMKVGEVDKNLQAVTQDRDKKIQDERDKIEKVIEKREKAIAHLKSQRSGFVKDRDDKLAEIKDSIEKLNSQIKATEVKRKGDVESLEIERDEELEGLAHQISYIRETRSGMGKDIEYLISQKRAFGERISHLRAQVSGAKEGMLYVTFITVGYTSNGKRSHIIFAPGRYGVRQKSFREKHISKDFFIYPFNAIDAEKGFVAPIDGFLSKEFANSERMYEAVKQKNGLTKQVVQAGSKILDEDGWLGGSRMHDFVDRYGR